MSMGIRRGPESDDGTENQSPLGFCGNCGATVTQRFCSQCGTRRAVGPALIPSPDAPRVSRPGSTVPDQERASTPAARSAAVGRLRTLKGTTRVGIAAGAIAVIGVIYWAAIGSSSYGSLGASGKSDEAAQSVALGAAVQYGKINLVASNAYYSLDVVRVRLLVVASGDGAICPTSADIYLLTGAGKRIEMSQSKGSCQTLNGGEKGTDDFQSPPNTVAGNSAVSASEDWLNGSKVVFAPGTGTPAVTWKLPGNGAPGRGYPTSGR